MTTSYIEKFWRPATDKDVARVMAGETVEARFRDDEANPWCSHGNLTGFKAVGENKLRWFTRTASWRFCQVYDPPQWWLNKPEPGEGFRLLGKEPDEPVQGGDFIRHAGGWNELADECNPTQAERIWYRRRIEQPKPEPKFAVGQRVKIVGGISGPYIGELAIIEAMAIEPTGWFYELRYVEGSFHEPNLEPVTPKHYVLQVGDTADVPSGHRIAITDYGVEVT